MLASLPEELDLEIFSYLELLDQENFIYANKFFFNRFLKGKLRSIMMMNRFNVINYLIFEDFRRQVLKMVLYPSKQLSVDVSRLGKGNFDMTMAQVMKTLEANQMSSTSLTKIIPNPSLSLLTNDITLPSVGSLQLNTLKVTDHSFYQYFLSALKRLQSLHLTRDPGRTPSFLPRVLTYLTTNASLLRLRELRLHGYRKLLELPYIPGVEKITLRYMSELSVFDARYFSPGINALTDLTIEDCENLIDVSMLGSVKNLTLTRCPNIIDISSLQRNQKVAITQCDGLRDYSNAFTHTRELSLQQVNYVQL